MRHANDVANTTPRKGDEVFGCTDHGEVATLPRFRLPHLCASQRASKRTGHSQMETLLSTRVYLGPSPSHARSVALVLNPRTGHVSPQFHVKFDDIFETVQDKLTELDAPEPEWKYLSGFAVWKGQNKTEVKGVMNRLLAP